MPRAFLSATYQTRTGWLSQEKPTWFGRIRRETGAKTLVRSKTLPVYFGETKKRT